MWLSRDGAPAGTTDLLEQAVREAEWLPGTVFARVAGEAVALKGIRRHLVTERQVPREHTHITGYWRALAAPAVPAEDTEIPEQPEHTDDAHERLHELTDLAPGYAIRTAVTLGLFDLVECASGSGLRTADRITGLTTEAGLVVRSLTDIGWDHRLFVVGRPPRG